MSSEPPAPDVAVERVSAGPYTLRPWEPADLTWVYHACQDAEIQRWTRVPHPYRPADALAFLERTKAERVAGTAYAFAIIGTDNDELLGSIDVRLGDEAGVGHTGYWVDGHSRGRGVGSAALDAITRWGFERLGLHEVRLEVARTNLASRRIAERAGFQAEPVPAVQCPDGDELVDAMTYVRHRPPAA